MYMNRFYLKFLHFTYHLPFHTVFGRFSMIVRNFTNKITDYSE